jgi:hypothetical protein
LDAQRRRPTQFSGQRSVAAIVSQRVEADRSVRAVLHLDRQPLRQIVQIDVGGIPHATNEDNEE